MRITTRLFWVVLITVSSGLCQQELSLDDAILTALKNNYDIRISESEYDGAEINNSYGTAGLYPTIDFSLSSLYQQDYSDLNDFTLNRTTYGITLNWTLFDGFSMWIRKEKLDYYQDLTAGHADVVIEGTIESVILAYYGVLLEQEKLEVAETLKKLSQDRYDYESERQQLGSLTTYDLLQAKNSWLEDQGRFMLQEAAFKNSVRDLIFLMGEESQVTYTFTSEFEPKPQMYDLESLRDKMMSNNRTLKNQYINQSLLEKEIRLKKSDWYPSLSLRGGYNNVSSNTDYLNNGSASSESYNYQGTLTLSWNLFNGGNRRRAVEIAQVDREIGQIEINRMEHSLANQLHNLYEIHLVRQELLNVAQEALDTAELNLTISEEKFRNGVINSFNYRDVQLLYLNTAVNRLNAIYAYIDVNTALMRLTGGIIAQYE